MTLAQAKPSNLEPAMRMLGEAAKTAAAELALAAPELKVAGLHAMAKAIRDQAGAILAANAEDMKAAEARNLSAALLDRLKLNDARVEAMAKGLEEIAAQPDPVGRTLAEWTRPNGLEISRVSVPLGVIGIIYESRPNVAAESRIPVLKHLDGLCHTYVHAKADPQKAREIVLNAKMRRTGVCGATETLLIDKGALAFAEPIIADLVEAGCEVRGDDEALKLHDKVKMASNRDWDTEYLDAIIAVRVVDGIEEAMEHINRHGSHHTEAILTEDAAAAERFLREIDAGIVLVNASTQFADGGEFGMGAEIGISTGKLHARGPVGAEQLTSYKYLVRGNGQIRP
jgi:glutamate-5-semialdehyde dehydrogenase